MGDDFHTLTTARLRAFFVVLRRDGFDVDAALARFDLQEEALLDPLHRMPRAFLLQLCGALGLRGEAGTLPLRVVDELEPGDLDLLGHLLSSAPTLGDALRLAERYIGLIHDGARIEVRTRGERALITHRIAGGRTQLPAMADFSVALMVRCIRHVTGGQGGPCEVRLARPRPAEPQAYRSWFGVPVHFDADVNAVLLPREALEAPLPRADRSLHAVLARQAEAWLATTGASGTGTARPFVERVRLQMAEDLARAPMEMTAAGLAARLRIGERTLRRRLENDGANYGDLLDDIRRERALARILDRRISLSALAAELGFSGTSAFGRAFRRWTGKRPTEYRADAGRDQGSD